MNLGIKPPRIMVDRHTIIKVVLLITDTWSGCLSSFIVRMSAKATDPRMVPAMETIES